MNSSTETSGTVQYKFITKYDYFMFFIKEEINTFKLRTTLQHELVSFRPLFYNTIVHNFFNFFILKTKLYHNLYFTTFYSGLFFSL
jgi:hypothetical protein